MCDDCIVHMYVCQAMCECVYAVYCLHASLCRHTCVCVCMSVFGLPEVSVLAVHGHTGTIWTWAAGENRRREGRKSKRKTKEGKKGIKEKVNDKEEDWSTEKNRGRDEKRNSETGQIG